MKKKTILKLLVTAVILAAAVTAGYYFLWSPHLKQSPSVATTIYKLYGWQFPPGATKFPSTGSAAGGDLAYSDIRDPGGIPQGLPVRLQIHVIAVDSAIEDALITPDGRMDVPAGSVNVAWFALGPHPGDVGSAVIGGHFGISNGVPFVFYNLDKLKIGDKVYILNDKGDTLAFIVRSIKSFDRNADASPVFTSSDGLAHLNLITCEGIWNQVNGNYPQRLVIFTDAIASEGAAPAAAVSPSAVSAAAKGGSSGATAVFSHPLSVGASGADVVALQVALEQRGLLELPQGVVNGFFGSLTRAAVIKYQASKGLPQVGAFGPLTMAKLNAELGAGTALPNTGTGSTVASGSPENQPISPISSPILIQIAEGAYATPLDGIITSLLLIGIGFVAFKIMRR